MKRIAVVHDVSGLGRCSMTAALPVLSVLKTQCCPLPTAVLSNQTGYDSFFCADFTQHMDAYIAEWKKLPIHFDGILTGYLASCAQADKILAFLDTFQTEQTLYVCDPVMADDGCMYDTYNRALCEKTALLAARAQVITPNLTELCILAGADYAHLTAACAQPDYLERIAAVARTLLRGSLHTVVVTGVCVGEAIHNILVTAKQMTVVSGKRFGDSYSGTGDLFSAVLTGELVNGKSTQAAVEKAVRFLEASIAESFRAGTNRNDGVNFENHLEMLL